MPRGEVTLSLREFSNLLEETVDIFSQQAGTPLPVLAYFGTLFLSAVACVFVVLPWPRLCGAASAPRGAIIVTAAAVCLSFTAWFLTWTPILKFISAHNAEYSDVAYEHVPSFFITAYEKVTEEPTGWFWSQQLLMWVLPACTFLPLQSRRLDLPSLAPLFIIGAGFLGAISLAFPFFFVTAWVIGRNSDGWGAHQHTSVRIRLLVLATTIVATSNVLALPATLHVSWSAYVLHLVSLHVILAVPTIAVLLDGKSTTSIAKPRRSCVPSMKSIYILQAACCFLCHAFAVYAALRHQIPAPVGDDELLDASGNVKDDLSILDEEPIMLNTTLRDLFLRGYVPCQIRFVTS